MRKKIERPQSVLEQTVAALRREVSQAEGSGDRLPPISQLAVDLGVSTNTVRSALTILAQEGLVELRHGSGTYVAERPCQEGKHVALLAEIDLLHHKTAFFFREMFRQLRQNLLESGHSVRFYLGTCVPGSLGTPYSEVAARQLIADIDRVSAVGAFLMVPGEPWIEPVRSRGIPIVSNDPRLGPSVNADRAEMLRLSAQALSASGCRRVGYLGWDPDPSSGTPTVDAGMYGMWAQLAQEYGFETRPEWMVYANHPSTSGAGWEDFHDLWRATREKPDGLIVTDDQLLTGVFEALARFGVRVPEQIRIASHFTTGLPILLPYEIIRIEYSPALHAQAMSDRLLAALRGDSMPAVPLLLPHRIVRPCEAGTAPNGELSSESSSNAPLPVLIRA